MNVPSKRRLTVKEKVDQIVVQLGCTYLEAITLFMQENNFTASRMAKSLCPYLFEKLHTELKYTKVIRKNVLDLFYTDGRIKMDKEQAIHAGQKIQEEIDLKESILTAIREKKKRDLEAFEESQLTESSILIYETKLEEELEILIDLSILCSIIAGE